MAEHKPVEDSEVEKRRDDALRRALQTQPKPKQDSGKAKPKRKLKQGQEKPK